MMLIKWEVHGWRAFVGGIFVGTQASIDTIKNAKGYYIGEKAGKHGYVEGPIEDVDIEVISEDPEIVQAFSKVEQCKNYPYDIFEAIELYKETKGETNDDDSNAEND